MTSIKLPMSLYVGNAAGGAVLGWISGVYYDYGLSTWPYWLLTAPTIVAAAWLAVRRRGLLSSAKH